MIDYNQFAKAWRDSGLAAYYERMDDLNRIGFTFDAEGDMDSCESQALREWLTDERTVQDIPLPEIEKSMPEIKDRAKQLRAMDESERMIA